jgi:DNA-binding NarL/FixJ family response regulator
MRRTYGRVHSWWHGLGIEASSPAWPCRWRVARSCSQRSVEIGCPLLAPSVTRSVIDEPHESAPVHRDLPPGLAELTPREREVLPLLARGRFNAEIARALVVSGAPIRTHAAHVLVKLGLRDRVQAVIYAYESGLIAAGEGVTNPG